jgi:Lrp/AsnC family transcriptional regulator
MDEIALKILRCLQEDAMMPLAEVAARVGLSPSPCWRRIQQLVADGTIVRRVALVNPESVNASVNVFVAVRTNQHSEAWANKFCRAAAQIPEVIEFYRMSGQVDYLLRIVVPNIAAYDEVYKRLIKTAELYDVSSSFAMETIKYTTALPLDYAALDDGEASQAPPRKRGSPPRRRSRPERPARKSQPLHPRPPA